MPNVNQVSTFTTNMHRKYIATARYLNQITGIWEKTVINETLPQGQGGTYNWPKYAGFTANSVADGVPISLAQTISTSNVQLTPSEIYVMWIMTKKAEQQASENVARAAASLANNAIKMKIDQDGVALASGYSTTVAGAGVTMTPGHITAAVANIWGNTTDPGMQGNGQGGPGGAGPITALLHPFSWQPLANDLIGLGAGGANAYPIADGPSAMLLESMMMGKIGGASIVLDPNITPAANSAANMIYGKNSAVICWWDKLSEDSDKDVTVRGTISVLTSDYAVAELNDPWGVYALAAASTPSS